MGKAIAADINLSSQGDETNVKNVKFDVYFDQADRSVKEKIADMNSEEVKLFVSVSVQGGGYLNNAQIELVNTNFKLKNNPEVTKFKLDSIQSEKGLEKELTIVAKKDELYDLSLLSSQSQIKLTGEYIDGKGNVTDIEGPEATKAVKISWTSDELTDEDIELNEQVITNKIYNIDGANKRVVQVLVSSKVKDNKAPVKSSAIEIANPEIGVNPEDVKVAGYTTKATNGKASLDFANGENSSWEYKAEEGKTYINVFNNAVGENVVAWAKSAEDKFVVTYIYDEAAVVAPFISNVKNTVDVYGRTNGTIQKVAESKLEELADVGDITKLESNVTKNIYKGKMYIGEDTSFETRLGVYVPYSKLVNTIAVQDLGDKVLAGEDEIAEGVSTYYKTTKINKAEALKILGTEGTIKVYNADDKTAPIKEIVLSEETEEDYYTFFYEGNVNKIAIEMSTAITEGTIEIVNEKAIKVSNADIAKTLTELKTNTNITVADENSNDIVNSNVEKAARVLEPVTAFNMSLDKKSLSTQSENDLRITAELKAKDESNKVYKNPVINIELPKEVKEASIVNITPVIGSDELTVKSHNVITNEAGSKVIVVELQGEQTKYSINTANIVIDTKIKTDAFIPSRDVEVKATCINDGENVQSKEIIKLVSKTGLVTKNTLAIGTNVIQKVNQNNLSLAISEDTNVNISTSIINNFEENISNINIVGKIPEGTTLTNAVLSNTEGIEVSYSEETNPTVDASSWKTEVTEYSKIKSFKLTLAEMAKASLIDLKYDLKANVADIKENTSLINDLRVNYSINGQAKEEKIAFNLNVVKEGANPYVSETPDEPQKPEEKAIITINPKTTTNTLHEDQIVTYEIKVKSTSAETLNNVTLDYSVPQGAVVTELTYAQGSEIVFTDDSSITNKTWKIETLNPNQTVTREVTLKIKDGAKEIINSASLKDAENTEIAQVANQAVKVNKGDLSVRLSRRANMEAVLTTGDYIQYAVIVKNNTNSTMNNVKITSQVPEHTSWVEDSELNENWYYDKNTNSLNYTIDTLAPGETKDIRFEVEVGNIQNDSCEATIDNTATVSLESGEVYETNEYTSYVVMPKLDIHMTSTHNATLKEGDSVKYVITVTNTGKTITTAYVQDILPDEIQFRKVAYYTDENDKIEDIITKKEIKISYPVEVGKTLTLEIEGVTYDLEDTVASKQISNVAKLDLGDGEYLESETITNTIVNDEVKPADPNNPSNPEDPENKTHSISGLAWLDVNKNGVRDNEEKLLQAIKVVLLDAKGNVVTETLTSLTGTYRFNDIPNGDYMVAFEYDTSKYGLTKYQVKGGDQKVNSDVISKEIKLNNETKLVGITDTIKIANSEAENIDMGLIENPEFDLSLNKYISKVVVTNKAGTSTYEYENTELAKVEISAKQIAGTVLLVEYEIEVTNEGDVNGYVTDIIDYLPKELEFNSEMNKEWYLGTDKYLHHMALEPQAIEPGKSQKVKLVLTKTLKSDSTGIIENIAEIGESTNLEGIKEHDSIAGNKQDGEDDISKASLIVSIKTGSPIMYVGIVLASMIILGAGIYIIDKKILRVRI